MATDDLLPELNEKLKELDELIYSETSCTEGIGFSYDDVDLWARLRSLTVIKGAQIRRRRARTSTTSRRPVTCRCTTRWRSEDERPPYAARA